MRALRCFIQTGMVVLTWWMASTSLSAQEIPYGVSDGKTLEIILEDAKAHLLTNENALDWLQSAGIASHQLATLKVKGASEDAVRFLKQASALAPDDVLTLAHLGSAYAMAGRDSSFVINKMSHVNKGLAALDKAVKKDPDNLTVRFIRAGVSYGLPSMFSRQDTAENDYLFYVNAAQAGADLDSHRLAEAYFKLGKMAQDHKRQADAQNFYLQAQHIAPQSDWAQQAARAM